MTSSVRVKGQGWGHQFELLSNKSRVDLEVVVISSDCNKSSSTNPFSMRVNLPNEESWLGLFDDQQCTGKRSRLDAALWVTTRALKYTVVSSATGLGTGEVKSESEKA